MNSMVKILFENAQKHPKRWCIIDGKGAYSYVEICSAVKRAAYELLNAGVKKEDRVLAECTQNADYLICDFACNLLGAYFVPVEHKASASNVQNIYEETEAVLLLCEENYEFPAKMLSYQTVVKKEGKELEVYEFPKGEETAEILYTTGTTGKSKGIEITHRYCHCRKYQLRDKNAGRKCRADPPSVKSFTWTSLCLCEFLPRRYSRDHRWCNKSAGHL